MEPNTEKKTSLEGTECRASDCCGATIVYNLGELLNLDNTVNKDAKPFCIRCQKRCVEVVYILVRKDRVKNLTVIE